MRAVVLLVTSLMFCIPAIGQDRSKVKDRIRREVLEKQQLMREGKVIRTNVRVTVRLHNGSRLRGVVKGGRVIERPDGLAFVPADVAEVDAGIRMWYYDGTNSYVFLPFSTIKDHDIGEKLTDEEVVAIEKRIDLDRRKAADARRRELARVARAKAAADKAKENAGGAKPGEEATDDEAEASDSPLSEEQAQLLAEFPPEAGWGKEKYDLIQKRKITIGRFPNESEQRFLDNFSQWQQAFHLSKIAEGESGDAPTSRPTTGAPAPGKK